MEQLTEILSAATAAITFLIAKMAYLLHSGCPNILWSPPTDIAARFTVDS
jgi:hypothetical protein